MHGLNYHTMSSQKKIFHITGPLWGESTSHRQIPLTKASDAELSCVFLSVPEQTPAIWDVIMHAHYDIAVMQGICRMFGYESVH